MGGKVYMFVCAIVLTFHESKGDSSQAIAQANTNFGLDLYKKIAQESDDDNIFFSPFSVSSALALFYAGARGQCATQMGEVLGYANDEQSHNGYKDLYEKVFQESTATYVLTLANRLFGSEEFEFKDEYLSDLAEYYDADLEDVDFSEPDEAREEINEWVAEETNDKIQDLFPEDSIKPNTILVLANAIYFKGTWKYMFKKENTVKGQFKSGSSGATQEVEYMQQTGAFKRGSSESLKASILEMPYSGENVGFYVVLPNADGSLADTEEALNHDSLQSAIEQMTLENKLSVRIPRYNMTWKMSLNGLLYDMGLKCPFGPGADFSGITDAGGLYASEVVHQAFVVVNEEGTEAAAATGVAVSRLAPPKFWVDRPFLFLIREVSTGSVLFMGRVTSPAGSAARQGAVPEMRFARYRREDIVSETEENPPASSAKTIGPVCSLLMTAMYMLVR